MSSSTISHTFSPGVLSVLPIFYVAWSDSLLSPGEIEIIHRTLEELPFLTDGDKEYLIKYTNPKNIPSTEIFLSWLTAIKKGARKLQDDKKKDLINLGLELAKANGQIKEGEWSRADTKDALVELQKALNISNTTGAELLLKKVNKNIREEDIRTNYPVKQMSQLLDGPYSEIRTKMKRLLEDPLFELKYESDKDIHRLLTLKRVKALADQGVSAFSFPKKFGGGEKAGEHIVVFEMLAYSDLSLTVKFGVQFGLFGGALYSLGTEKHHKKYLEAMHKAELLGCFAMTETGHGSNVKGLCTTATYDKTSDELIIHSPDFASGKEYIGNALHAEMGAVFAQLIVDGTNHGVHAVLVPMRDHNGDLLKGIRVEDCGDKIGLNGVDNGRIWFDQVRVPRENLLDKYGAVTNDGQYNSPIENPSKRFFTMLGALVTGRISVGLASVNAAKKALTIASKYAVNRRQFAAKDGMDETRIIDYPTHQARLLPSICKTYAYYFALRDLADEYTADIDGSMSRRIETLAAGLKSKASWHATATIQECREACGGKGYLLENQLGVLKADTDIFTTFEGDNTVLMQLVAKGLLTEFKQSFHNEGIKAVMSFLMKKVDHKVQENNPIQRRNTDYKHLTSHTFLKDAFEYRYNKLMINLSERMKKYLSRRMDPYQAFLKCQIHMVDLADAYIDYISITSITNKYDISTDQELKDSLSNIIQLYGLQVLHENKGWYLETEYFDGTKTKAIRRVRNKLMLEMKKDIIGLVDAFGIPDHLIAAPIAQKEFS